MERLTTKHYVLFAFTLAGLLFSGYLAGTKIFSDTCAFGAECPIFLGYPACYTGFIVYSILTVVSLIALFKKQMTRLLLAVITGVSLFGVLFSGKLTLVEMSVWFSDGFMAFLRSLPLCSIGLIFYAVIFILSLVIGNRMDKKEEEKKIEAATPAVEISKVEENKTETSSVEAKTEIKE